MSTQTPSRDELVALATQLWQRLMPSSGQPHGQANRQPLSALEQFETMAQLRLLTKLLRQPLDALLPAAAAEADGIPSEVSAESEADLERFATLVTTPVLRSFGHRSLLMLGLPPVADGLWPRPTVSTPITRAQAWQLRDLAIPDPWASPDPGASARLPVVASSRK